MTVRSGCGCRWVSVEDALAGERVAAISARCAMARIGALGTVGKVRRMSVDAELRAASGVFGDPGSRRVVYDTTVPLPPASSPNRYSRWTNAKARKDPALVPAPDRAGDDAVIGGVVEELVTPVVAGTMSVGYAGSNPATASTVTQSALTATAYTAIDHVPATPVSTPARVETIAPQSIKSYEPWPAYLWPTVACIVQRESRGDPYAVGSAGERGLLQIHPATWGYLAQYGITPDSLWDPATNIRAGYLLFVEAGSLRPWGGGCA